MSTFTLVVFVLYTFGSVVTSTSQQVTGFTSKALCEKAKEEFKSNVFSGPESLQYERQSAHFDTYCVEVSTKEIHNGR